MGNNRCPSENDERLLFCSLSGTVILVAIVYTYRVDSLPQIPSTGLRHPSFGERCLKAMLGV